MLPQPELAAVLHAADVFITPSVYEPLGIVNLAKEGKREMMVSLLDKAPLADGGQPMRQGRDLVGKGLRKLQRYERAHRPAPLR